MKKYIVLALSLVFVLGLAAYAFAAEVEFNGDYRVRGIMKNDFDFNSDADDDNRYWDQRFRLAPTIKLDGGVEIKSRMTVSNGTWDGASTAASGVAGDPTSATGGNVKLDSEDYAYAVVPVNENVKLQIGRQHSDWGNKFLTWNKQKDRFKVVYDNKGGLLAGGFIDKDTEISDGLNENDDDSYGVFAVNTFGDWKAGLLVVYSDNANSDSNAATSGQIVDIFFNGKAGMVALAGELVYKGGDAYENGEGSSPMGMFVAGDLNFEPVLVHIAVAYASNGFTTNRYFTPTLFVGTSGDAGMLDFGSTTGSSVDDSSYAFVLAANYKISDAMNAGVTLAYLEASSETDDNEFTEFDIKGAYKLTKNATWSLALGYLMSSASDTDAAMSLVQKVNVTF